MEKLIIIKLGGSLITNKGKTLSAKKKIISRLAREIASARSSSKTKILVVHDSGPFGQTPTKSLTKDNLPGIAHAARQINQAVMNEFHSSKLPAVSLSPSSFLYTRNEKLTNMLVSPLYKTLSLGHLPVVYSDIVFDDTKNYILFSGETIIANLIRYLNKKYLISKIIYCTASDGVVDKAGNTITHISINNFPHIKGSIKSTTPGVIDKVEAALGMAQKSYVRSLVINGSVSGRLKKAILDQNPLGTTISRD